MYVMFADGSGSGRAPDLSRDPGFYVLSGVVVHESNLRYLQVETDRLKQSLFPGAGSNEVELHAQEIWNSHGLFRSDKYGLTLEDKRRIFDRDVGLGCDPAVKLISVAVDKGSDVGMRGRHWPLERSWIDLVKAFKHYLSPKNGAEYGLIIADACDKGAEHLIEKTVYKTARRYGTRQRRSPVFDGVFFRDSRLESLIQLADMAGYVIHKHIKGDPAFAAWYGRLERNTYVYSPRR